MFLQIPLLTFMVLQIVNGLPLQDDKIDPVDLNYSCVPIKEHGKGHYKSPILLLHGVGSSHSVWNSVQQVLALRTGRRVCAVDLRNHGDSPWNSRSDVEAMAVDVGHFLDKQNIPKVNIIGHSLGGKISLHYTLKHVLKEGLKVRNQSANASRCIGGKISYLWSLYKADSPERVESLVVEDMRTNSIPPKAVGLTKMNAKLRLDAIKAVPEGSSVNEARKVIAEFLKNKLSELGINKRMDTSDEPIICTNGKCQWKMNMELLLQVVNNPLTMLTESKGLYEGPTLFIYGKKSIFDVYSDEENIHKLFPNAKLFGVEGAEHSIHGKFREFEDEVIKFLNK